jgi:superfamily I DNA/RNA helicase
VHYLKRLLAGHKARLGNKDILVTHFYAFCRSILREPLTYENEDADYYALVTRLALDAARDSPAFGAVFVDEGQDFSDAMLQVLLELIREDGLFWIALDQAQALYTRNQSWLADKAFHHFSLRRPYRATRALTDFCESLLARGEENCPAEETQPECFAVRKKQGEKPRLSFVPNLEQGAAYLVERIRELRGRGIPYAEMMILYASRKRGDAPGKELPEFLLACLEENGILASWLSRDAQSKASWDITTDSVALSTIHSMKGMDAQAVFVLGLDGLETGHMTEEAARALAYVACTRAREYLDIVYCAETPLIAALRQAIR